jgi:DNA polymerase III subunit beta
MEFSVLQEDLSKYISYLGRIVDTKPSLPVLGNIVIDASQDGLELTASNLEVSMQINIDAEVKSKGVTTVPAKTFAEFVSSLPAGSVEVKKEGQMLIVQTENTEANFNTMVAEDFPEMPTYDKDPELVLDSHQLDTALKRVTFSAGQDGTNPVFAGVYLDSIDGEIALVSSDGYRLSKQLIEHSKEVSNFPWLVPVNALEEVAKLASVLEDESEFKFYLVADGKQILIQSNNVKVYSRIIEGEYPDYEAVIPNDNQITAEIDYELFKENLSRVNIFAREVPGNKVKFKFDPKANQITLEATLVEVGSNQVVFPADIKGNELEIIFSSRSVNDLLSNVKSGVLLFEGTGPESAGVFKFKEMEDYLHIIMPMSM